MVVVHRVGGYRLVIYTMDHEPAHVHVTGPGQAKIDLIGDGLLPELVWSYGISKADLRLLMLEVIERRAYFLFEWRRIHGPAD